MAWSDRLLRRTAAVLALAALGACASTGPDPGAARDYVVEAGRLRADAAARHWSFKTIAELVPADGAAPGTAATDAFVVGRVTSVEEGVGFALSDDPDAGEDLATGFDDSKAAWRTLELTVAVDRQIGGAPVGETVRVGYVIDASTDPVKAAAGLQSLGTVVLPLVSSPVFAYKPSLRAIASDAELLMTLDESERLDLPFLDDSVAARLLAPTPTLPSLAAMAKKSG